MENISKKALKRIKEIKNKYKFNFFEDEVLSQTDKLFLYNMSVNFFVYDRGLEYAANTESNKLKKIWETFIRNKSSVSRSIRNRIGTRSDKSGFSKFLSYRKKYLKAIKENDLKDLGKYAIKMVRTVEDKLTMKGFLQFLVVQIMYLRLGKLMALELVMKTEIKKLFRQHMVVLEQKMLRGQSLLYVSFLESLMVSFISHG